MYILIILGNKLLDEGKIDEILIERLNKGITMYNIEKYDLIIVSGGNVQENSVFSESYVMKNYLLKYYIPKNKIIEENKSMDTIQNSLKCLNIVNKFKNIKQINILSSEFHIERVKAVFNHYFYKYNLKYIKSNNIISGEILKKKIKNEKKYLSLFNKINQ